MTKPKGAVAVIFLSQRTESDEAGYEAAADAMVAEASVQPGYLGIDSVRGGNGEGITISWWADEAAALAWRANVDHRTIQAKGRSDWYERYQVIVAEVTRSYDWPRND